MSAPPFRLEFTDEARKILKDLETHPVYAPKRKKAQKALKLLRDSGPSYPSLHSHKYESMAGPNGEEVWESYLENQTPRAWRAFWHYVGADTIRILTLQPHP